MIAYRLYQVMEILAPMYATAFFIVAEIVAHRLRSPSPYVKKHQD